MTSGLNTTNWYTHATAFATPVNDTYPFISAHNTDSMRGKSVLITGASRGIGLTTAVHFARAGCTKIALAARSSLSEAQSAVEKAAAEANTKSPTILVLNMDISSADSVQAAAEQVKAAFGHLDILINNAGYLSSPQEIGSSDPAEYAKTWSINLNGTYLCVRYFLPLLLDSQLKTVINVASAGAHVLFPGASAYQTSKFALCRFTEFLDAEYAARGLVAIALDPGAVRTKLALNLPQRIHELLTDTPEMAADTMLWLCKEKREWLRGRFVTATWNMEDVERRRDEIVERDMLKFRMLF